MKDNKKHLIVVSAVPGGTAHITSMDVDHERNVMGMADAEILRIYGGVGRHDRVAEILPRTQQAIDGFCVKHNAQLGYPTLADYPMPRGD